MRQDLRYALRMLRKNPFFALAAVLTIALGLGANTAIFTLVDAVLLKPLPYPEPDRLIMVFEKPPGSQRNSVSALNFLDWRENSKTSMLTASQGNWLTMTGSGEPQRVLARQVTFDYFEMLGCPAATGRTFLPQEGVPGQDRVLLVSHRFWQQRLGGDPNILGRTLVLDSSAYKVVGTLPANSWFDRHPADVWMPLAITHTNSDRNFHSLAVYGRLRPGATIASARAELESIAARIARDYPASNKGSSVTLDFLADRVVGDQTRQALYVLFAAVGAVLLIACVNLANLLLARSATREREVWVRMSLGAGQTRLVRQFLTESVLLALAGAVAGCGLGYALLQALLAWMPPGSLPTQADVRLDLRVLSYLLALAVTSGLLFGIAPAISAWRKDVAEGLQEGYRGSTGGVTGRHVRAALIVAEVALAFVLVAGAGSLVRSFMRLTGVETGVDMTNVISMNLVRSMGRDTDGAREANLMRRIRESVAGLPGVMDAAVTSGLPLQGWGFGMPYEIVGRTSATAITRSGGGFKIVSPSYFRTLGMRIVAGRGLADTDRAGAAPVTVINQTMARRVFRQDDPIGQHIRIQQIVTGKRALGPWIPWEIVGVVSDEKTNALDGDATSGVYVTFDQSPIVGVGMVVRTHGDPQRMTKAIQKAVWSVNPDLAITDMKLLEQIKSESAASARFVAMLLMGFAVLAMSLAAVGIYGVVAYSVTERRREMGIRAALGATGPHLLGLALRSSVTLTALGLALGALGIRWTGRLLTTLLFHTKPTEISTLGGVAGVLALVALAASVFPAMRAARVDPATALRHE